MVLMTEKLKQEFLKYPLYSQEGKGMNAKVIVKYFNPCGAGTWLITEAEEQSDGDWLMFGYCHITEWEWGYVLLSELQSYKPIKGLPLGIERDLYSKGTVKELSKY